MAKLYIANWKMCGEPAMALQWAEAMVRLLGATWQGEKQVVVCPPAPLLPLLKSALSASSIALGGQNCHAQPEGAYTGEISAPLLRAVGCDYVLVGHSERRALCGETSEIVRQKAARAIASGLIPVICIGETAQQRAEGQTLEVIQQQIDESLPEGASAQHFVLAYEPVWAIGSGKVPTLDEIAQVHAAIIAHVAQRIGLASPAEIGQVTVLYGGSVKPDNAKDILAVAGVSGVLVGGASLKADDFYTIVESGA